MYRRCFIGMTNWLSCSPNTNPIPIPALNNIANQESNENSGSSPSTPNVMDAYLENNKYTQIKI